MDASRGYTFGASRPAKLRPRGGRGEFFVFIALIHWGYAQNVRRRLTAPCSQGYPAG